MEWTTKIKKLYVDTANKLKGTDRRVFMAQTVDVSGRGGQRKAERELGWDRGTIRKGMHELESGIACVDAFTARGRKPVEEHLPSLLDDIKEIVDSQSQADPRFESCRLYRRITAAEVIRQLIAQKGYTEDELPHEETIRKKLNQLGYQPNKVLKSKPKKKSRRPMRSSSGLVRSTDRPMRPPKNSV